MVERARSSTFDGLEWAWLVVVGAVTFGPGVLGAVAVTRVVRSARRRKFRAPSAF